MPDEVEFANGNHRVPNLVTNAIAVNLERFPEVVVLLVLLQLLEGGRYHGGVKQADLRCGVGVAPQCVGVCLGLRVERRDLNVVEAVRISGRVDIALDVRRFLLLRVWANLEALHDRGIDAADRDRGDHHEPNADRGNAPVWTPDHKQKHASDEQRDANQDAARRKDRVDVGVRRAVELLAHLVEQAVPLQPIVGGDANHDERTHNRELDARAAGGDEGSPSP